MYEKGGRNLTIEAEIAQARSNLYHWFSYLFRFEPSEEKMKPFFDPDVMQSLNELFYVSKAGEDLLNVINEWKDGISIPVHVKRDYQELFKVPGNKYLLPYESCYRGKLADGSLGLIYGKSTGEVTALYHLAKIEHDQEELPDFFGNELFFMAQLAAVEAEMWEQGEAEIAKRYQGWQQGFLKDHLRKWAGEFLEGMKGKSETVFYQSIAQLVDEFLAEDFNYLVGEKIEINSFN